jgi:hypothetical protein
MSRESVEEIGPFELFVRKGPGWRLCHSAATVTANDLQTVRDRRRQVGLGSRSNGWKMSHPGHLLDVPHGWPRWTSRHARTPGRIR